MTAWHYRWLCQFSYIDIPGERHNQTLSEISRELLTLDSENKLSCGHLSNADREALRVLRQTPALSELLLVDFIRNNSTSGFVAYVLSAPDNSLHCIFRGSETKDCGVPTGIDWLDNFLAPFYGSVQYRDIETLVQRLHGRIITFSGHSKGAHNALYALSISPENTSHAIVFNGQGFAREQLSPIQQTRMAERGIHYVVCGDVVGSLLYHPEKRIFVRKQGKASAHALASLSFDENGQPLQAMRPLSSWGIEWATRAYLHLHQKTRSRLKYGNVVNRIASEPHP